MVANKYFIRQLRNHTFLDNGHLGLHRKNSTSPKNMSLNMFNIENSIEIDWLDNFSTGTGGWKIQTSWVIIGNYSYIIIVNEGNRESANFGPGILECFVNCREKVPASGIK